MHRHAASVSILLVKIERGLRSAIGNCNQLRRKTLRKCTTLPTRMCDFRDYFGQDSTLKVLERETGIEPATSSLGSWRSTAELLPPG